MGFMMGFRRACARATPYHRGMFALFVMPRSSDPQFLRSTTRDSRVRSSRCLAGTGLYMATFTTAPATAGSRRAEERVSPVAHSGAGLAVPENDLTGARAIQWGRRNWFRDFLSPVVPTDVCCLDRVRRILV